MRSRLVTLTTDAGQPYAAQMKGVLSRTLPRGSIVDLADDLAPHRVEEAAFLLRHMGATVPPGTVHLAVVDPGVGGARAPVAVECREGSYLVGPDNGLLAPLAEFLGIRRVVRIERERFAASRTSSPTFDGRDLFAPAAGRLARGTRIQALGPTTTLTRRSPPPPRSTARGVRGHVVHVDRFGNLITDIAPSLTGPEGTTLRVRVGLGKPARLVRRRTYEDGTKGNAMLLVSSFGLLELSVREGSAARRYRAGTGATVTIELCD
ncbi:MAG: SAM-dependent chlorinase/fluorinase [Thermoplasmata archaeon]|nr:SAM-dependent chlorinase/fluorinase [Thermoplasmata archaeon]